MRAVLNDIAFGYMFVTKELAVQGVHNWLDLCTRLGEQGVTRVQEIYGNPVDMETEIAPKYKMIQLVQEFKDREDRSRLLGLLMNSRCFEENDTVVIDGKESAAAAFAGEDGVLVSLLSNDVFASPMIDGMRGEEQVIVDNISKKEHLKQHAGKLGIRYYERNEKHGNREYARAGGYISSMMDLSDELAQRVLDAAVEIDGHLYGCYAGNYYEFRRTEGNTYHCYRNSNLTKDLRRKIDRAREKIQIQ